VGEGGLNSTAIAIDSAQAVVERLVTRLFDKPLIRNDLRGELVEEIVGIALHEDWELSGDDWASHDLGHRRGNLRIQVKQSAARQSWENGDSPIPKPRFSIASKTGRWEGPKWIVAPGRNAEIFIFAWHPVRDNSCDHREPDQWQFYVIPETALPSQKSLGLAQVEALAAPVTFSGLSGRVKSVCDALITV
jgi:hypothetical protein